MAQRKMPTAAKTVPWVKKVIIALFRYHIVTIILVAISVYLFMPKNIQKAFSTASASSISLYVNSQTNVGLHIINGDHLLGPDPTIYASASQWDKGDYWKFGYEDNANKGAIESVHFKMKHYVANYDNDLFELRFYVNGVAHVVSTFGEANPLPKTAIISDFDVTRDVSSWKDINSFTTMLVKTSEPSQEHKNETVWNANRAWLEVTVSY